MEEDAVLRDILKRTLEGKGVLSQIRASLRAAVFTCLDEQERASGVYVPNPTALTVKRDSSGLLALQIVVDFLTHFELVKTLSVLKTETNMGEGDALPRADLVSVLGIGDGEGGPAIIQLIERKCQSNSVIEGETLEQKASLSERTDTMHSTEVIYESLSREDGLVDVRARSTEAQPDVLATPASTMSEEEKVNREGLYVNESVDNDDKKARSTDVDSHISESSAGDDEEGVRTREINEDTMHSTGIDDEGPSLEPTLFEERARSTGAPPDIMSTSGSTMSKGENKGEEEGLSVNQSVDGDAEKARSTAGDDDEGVRTMQINEDTIHPTRVKDESPTRKDALVDERATSTGAQPELLSTSGSTMSEREEKGDGEGLYIDESVNGSKERARSTAMDSNCIESSAGDEDEGVRAMQISEDTIHPTGLEDEGVSHEDALVDERARSTGAQPELLSTSGSTMSEEEDKGDGEGLSVDESINGSEKRARSTALDCNFIESSAGDDEEGVRTREIIEDTMHSTGLENESSSLEPTPFEEKARSTGAQPDMLSTSGSRMSEGEGKENGEGLYVDESVNASGERACSTAVDSNFIESSAGDDAEGVHTMQINEDTMYSTEFEDEGPSLEHTPFDERAYDFVEQAASTGAQPDLLAPSASTMSKGEDKGNGEVPYIDSINGSEERAWSTAVDSNISESSAGDDDEGVRTKEINEDTMHSTGLEDEDPSLEHTPFDERAYDFVEQARSTGAQPDMLSTSASTMSNGEEKDNGEGLSVDESIDGSGGRVCSTAVDSNSGESSAVDDEQGVRTRHINEDKMYSTEFEDERPSLEHTPFDERAYDFVEQAASTGAQPDMLSTPGSTMSEGEDKGNGEAPYIIDSVNGSQERARSTVVGYNCRESSAGDDDEGVRTRQINEDTMHATGLKDEGPYLEHTPFDERAYDFVEQARSTGVEPDMLSTSGNTMSEREDKGDGEGLSVDESINGSGERVCSTAVDSNCGESSAGDDEEGVRTRQINKDTMHSTEFEDKGPSLEHTPFDERAYDFVEQARSMMAQPDMLSTPGSTMLQGGDKGNGEGLSVNDSVNGSQERARSTVVGFNCRKSSTGDDDEAVRTRQINKGNGMTNATGTATAPASRWYESEPLATSSPPCVPYSGLRIESERFCRSERVSVAGASNGDVDFGHAEGIRACSEGDDSGNEGSTSETVKVESARLGTGETGEDGQRVSSTGDDVGVPEEILGMDLSSGGGLEVQGERHVIMEGDHSAEEVLFEATLSEISDQDQGRKTDANWEFMDDFSADSSFSVDERRALDDQGFDFEDAKSV